MYKGKTHAEVHNTMVLFLMVQQAVMPTNVLPAPQGSTMMPDRARLLREKESKNDEDIDKYRYMVCHPTHCQTSCSGFSLDRVG